MEELRAVGLEVRVTGGTIRGAADRINGELKQYLGIPYTAPPTGDLRWAHPELTAENPNGVMELGTDLRVGNNLELPRLDLIGKAWAKRRQAGAADGDGFKAGNRPG